MSSAARIDRLRARFDELGVDALLVTTPSNRRWVAGFTGSAGVALVTREGARFATDSRYWEQVGRECPDYELVRVAGATTDATPAILEGMGELRLGFEPSGMTVADHDLWQQSIADLDGASRPELVAAPRAIEDLRMVKEPDELDALTRAVLLGDEACRYAMELIEPGMTEQDIAWAIQSYAMTHGADDLSFGTIVAGGAHGALPHWRASEAPLEAGTGVVIDMGVIVDGYCSDLTRTVFLGEPDDEFRRIYSIVLEAQVTAEEQIEAGMPGREGHRIAADVIAAAGHAEHFGHGLGHGVGLDIHEDPRLAPTSDQILEDGQVVTVEPGIYIPGWGGVRIEDQCVIEDGRLRPISTAPKLDL